MRKGGELLYSDFGEQYKIEFDISGSPRPGQNTLQLALRFKEGNSQTIRFDFGTQSSESKNHVSFNKKEGPRMDGLCDVEVKMKDGYPSGKQFGTHFDNKGQIIYEYSNEQSSMGLALALALFDNPNQALTADGHNAFRALSHAGRTISTAGEGRFGQILGGNLEKSNIDSTAEFANIVMLQRMFQACSQIMEIDKQLIEEIYQR